MHYVLMDSTGNLIDSYDREEEAHAALNRIVHEEPEAADHVALLTYDDEGNPVGQAVTISASGAAVR
ncbi:MAG: hypothetical protein WD844_17545 [Thermoleophilaceae bacterium]